LVPAMVGRPCPSYLFDGIEVLADRLASSKRVFLFLDYDGTLSPIPRRRVELERPLGNELRELLKRISRLDKVVVSIVSGRSVETLKRLVGLEGIYYAGVHGHVVEGPGARLTHCVAESLSHIISSFLHEVAGELSKFGAVIEDKGFSFSVHYRGVRRENVEEIQRILYGAVARLPSIRIRRGKSILEVLPNSGWDKGKAIAYMVSIFTAAGGPGIPIYFGDDYTDESAFRTVNLAQGISVRVGQKCRTNARYYVRGVGDVKSFLEDLETMLKT